MRAVYLLAMLALAGCADPPNPKLMEQTPVVIEYKFPKKHSALEFRLLDGTRCVRVSNNAIDCAWPPVVVRAPAVQ